MSDYTHICSRLLHSHSCMGQTTFLQVTWQYVWSVGRQVQFTCMSHIRKQNSACGWLYTRVRALCFLPVKPPEIFQGWDYSGLNSIRNYLTSIPSYPRPVPKIVTSYNSQRVKWIKCQTYLPSRLSIKEPTPHTHSQSGTLHTKLLFLWFWYCTVFQMVKTLLGVILH